MTTTLSVTEDIRDMVKAFGNKGETYSEILRKLLESAKKQQLQDFLMDTRNTAPVRDALFRAKKQWQK